MAADAGLRQLFRRKLPDLDWQPMELGTLGVGVPDSNYCADGIEGWVEFKHTDHWAVRFRPQQPSWISRRVSAGGLVGIAVRQTRGSEDWLWMIPGSLVMTVAVTGLRGLEQTAARWPGGPKKWDWPTIRAGLLSRST